VKLGVLGGTFDPVHIGHLVLAEEAREQLGLTQVLLVPAGQPWRKEGRDVSTAEHRVAMLRLAVEGDTGYEVSLLEVERDGPTYTVETLAALRDETSGAEMYFILGEDSLADLPNWREPERILELAMLAVARRTGEAGMTPQSAAEGLSERVRWLSMPRMDVSASDIRERVRSGRSIRHLVPEAVREYIATSGLYR